MFILNASAVFAHLRTFSSFLISQQALEARKASQCNCRHGIHACNTYRAWRRKVILGT